MGTPFFIFFGWLSDKIGRKPIILGGCLIAAITYFPIYQAMIANANVTYDAAGKIASANPNIPVMTVLVWIQIIYVTMVYGPIAAFLVEFFPAQARYTSLSIPYHLGNGEFGGWLPTIYLSLVGATIVGAGYLPFLGIWDLRSLNPGQRPQWQYPGGPVVHDHRLPDHRGRWLVLHSRDQGPQDLGRGASAGRGGRPHAQPAADRELSAGRTPCPPGKGPG